MFFISLYNALNQFIVTNSAMCVQQCPLECDSVFFDASLSSLTFPNEQTYNMVQNDRELFNLLENLFNQTVTFDSFKESYVSFNIYFPSLEYMDIRETPQTTVTDLFSGIGGSLGMLLGFSVFSVLESLEIVAYILYVIFSNKKR